MRSLLTTHLQYDKKKPNDVYQKSSQIIILFYLKLADSIVNRIISLLKNFQFYSIFWNAIRAHRPYNHKKKSVVNSFVLLLLFLLLLFLVFIWIKDVTRECQSNVHPVFNSFVYFCCYWIEEAWINVLF